MAHKHTTARELSQIQPGISEFYQAGSRGPLSIPWGACVTKWVTNVVGNGPRVPALCLLGLFAGERAQSFHISGGFCIDDSSWHLMGLLQSGVKIGSSENQTLRWHKDLGYCRFKNSRGPHGVIPQGKSPPGSPFWKLGKRHKMGETAVPRTMSPVLPMISSLCLRHGLLCNMSDLWQFAGTCEPIVIPGSFFLKVFFLFPSPIF